MFGLKKIFFSPVWHPMSGRPGARDKMNSYVVAYGFDCEGFSVYYEAQKKDPRFANLGWQMLGSRSGIRGHGWKKYWGSGSGIKRPGAVTMKGLFFEGLRCHEFVRAGVMLNARKHSAHRYPVFSACLIQKYSNSRFTDLGHCFFSQLRIFLLVYLIFTGHVPVLAPVFCRYLSTLFEVKRTNWFLFLAPG
jgi:hypothetical protein